jgi:hypothetical protein
MKKIILTIAIAVSILGISITTFAKTGSDSEARSTLPSVSNINEIEVHGNVEVYLTSGTVDKVTVYDNYYSNNALVQEHNNTLRITSYAAKKLLVWVTVSNLSKLSIYDQSTVNSFGKFSAIDVDVNLYDHALAKLDLDVFNASFALNGRSAVELSGNVENGALKYGHLTHINDENLTAANLTESLYPRLMRHSHHMELASL